MRRTLHRYGDDPSHLAERFEPAGEPAGAAVVLHGGFWREPWNRHLMDDVCADLAGRGWTAWNVEYRRLGSGGGWPETGDDVAAAIRALAGPGAVAIGHSAGGHLALWAAAEGLVRAAVAQAGVVDLRRAHELALGRGAAAELLGPGLDFGRASPAERLPLRVPQLLVHGEADETVPVELSCAYAEAARAAGDEVELVVLPGGHYEHLDPASDAWAAVVRWLR